MELPYAEMRRVIAHIDYSGGGDGLIQFSEFLLAGCSKKNLLTEANVMKEFTYLDMDKDN